MSVAEATRASSGRSASLPSTRGLVRCRRRSGKHARACAFTRANFETNCILANGSGVLWATDAAGIPLRRPFRPDIEPFGYPVQLITLEARLLFRNFVAGMCIQNVSLA